MILVTGGTGLVGAHILYDLCQTENLVKACKRNSSSLYFIQSIFEFYSPENHQELFAKIEWIDADITDVDAMYDATSGIEIVYHAAAIVSFQKKDVNHMIESNITGTANLVNACKHNKVRKIGHISSVSVLGPAKNGEPLAEKHFWEISKDNSNYAISKHGAEREVWRINEEGVDIIMVNPSLITGPGDWKKSSTAIFNTVHGGLKFYTEGCTGFVDVRDVSKTIIQLVNSDLKSERFVLSSENVIWRDLFGMISSAFGIKAPTSKVTKSKAEIAWRVFRFFSLFTGKTPQVTKETARSSLRLRYFSSDKIKAETGIEFIPIEESVKTTVAFLNSYYISRP
ncbi:MAG: NAD-dependent epimerase/dehydratase family protein [Flavobacteriales bacterium]|nr:NAD-dependent epimerase/dehydratase family protein [Flavobacteriales bacterium]